ncbi:MAG TPA: protein kinase [Pyrinomonadaceae bacterium]|nr:protein kinase [Pyrinomonadaceae bacterium]
MEEGTKLGKYEIKRMLGKGGMGEVYLAHDEGLDREVAIKVLLPEFCCNLERVNRFKLEARTVSALNHPNIITIHEIGVHDGQIYIVTEYIKGETLRSMLERKAVNFGLALQIAEQLTNGLTAAHKAGIIHRDLKPENIMIRADGIVKILDFGLAKPTKVESEAETRELVSTKAGMVMGSISYMSPEQARGKETDERTDLWSVGVVLYETIAGSAPFEGETMTDILANIIYKEPIPVLEIIEDAPAEIHRILKKSLRKDREERYQSAKDLLLDVKNLRREMELEHELEVSISPHRSMNSRSKSFDKLTRKTLLKSTDEVAETKMFETHGDTKSSVEIEKQPVKKRRSMAFIALLGLIFLGTLSVLSYYWLQKIPLVFAFDRNANFSTVSKITSVAQLQISPDGKYLAYLKDASTKNSKLILRQIETGSENEITPIAENEIGILRFSPDANYVYFTMKPKGALGFILYRAASLGEEPKQIAFDVDSGVSFRPDGKTLIFHRHIINPSMDKIFEIGAEGGEEKEIYSSEKMFFNPQLSPDGKAIVLMTIDKNAGLGKPSAAMSVLPSEGGELRQIGNIWNYVEAFSWLTDGSGLIISGFYEDDEESNLYVMSFPDGDVKPLVKDANAYSNVSLTADSKTIATVQSSTVAGIWEFETDTGKVRQISPNNKERLGVEGLTAAPNGKLVYSKSISKDECEIWELDVQSNVSKRLSAPNTGRNAYPQMSSDGNYIFYENFSNGSFDIWRMNADGTNRTQITKTPEIPENLSSISPDGKTVIFIERDKNMNIPSIKQINVETGETTAILQNDKQYPDLGKLSPDGKSLLYINAPINFDSGVMPQMSLYVASFDGKTLGEPRQIVKTLNSNQYKWSPDGKSILFTDLSGGNSDIWRLNPADGKTSKITNFNLESIVRYAAAPNGKKIYLVRRSTTQDIILIKAGTN